MSARRGFFFTALYLSVAAGLFAQDAAFIPEEVRRPRIGEVPRYPRDVVIGELGRGEAPQEAYEYARRLLAALTRGEREGKYLSGLGSAAVEEITGSVSAIGARKFRIGGGREEMDGSVSFLIRFIGRERGIAGELYLTREEETWRCDDLLIEESREIPERGSPYVYDFTPYERLY